MVILDDFLPIYDDLKAFTLSCDFKDEVNPVDGVVYPYICRDIPYHDEIINQINISVGRDIVAPTLFLRMSPEGVDCPHIVHSDKSMGDYSFMLYFHEEGGTALLRHRDSGITYNPEGSEFVDLVQRDQNSPEKWVIYQEAKAKPNRGAIFDAGLLHAAQPIGGFGASQADSRIVLTCFFS